MRIGLLRRLRMLPTRLRLGFWPYEVWSLDMTIAAFALPRLRYLRKLDSGHPTALTSAEWQAILEEIIWTLEAIVDDSAWYGDYQIVAEPSVGKAQSARIAALEDRRQAGCELFGKYFQHLWD